MTKFILSIICLSILETCGSPTNHQEVKVKTSPDNIKFEKFIFLYRNCHGEEACIDIYLQIENNKSARLAEKRENIDSLGQTTSTIRYYHTNLTDSLLYELTRILNRIGIDTITTADDRLNSDYILYYNNKRKVFYLPSSSINDDLPVLLLEYVLASEWKPSIDTFEMEEP